MRLSLLDDLEYETHVACAIGPQSIVSGEAKTKASKRGCSGRQVEGYIGGQILGVSSTTVEDGMGYLRHPTLKRDQIAALGSCYFCLISMVPCDATSCAREDAIFVRDVSREATR